MPVFEPPPTWANPVLVQKDALTGKDKSGFNPVWLKWFVDLAAILSGGGTGGGGFSLPFKQIPFGSFAGFMISSDAFTWDDQERILYISPTGDIGTLSGGAFFIPNPIQGLPPVIDPERGQPGSVEVLGSPNGDSSGTGVNILGGNAGSLGGHGGGITINAGENEGVGEPGDVDITAGNCAPAGTGTGGDVNIASGAGDGGGDSGNVNIVATPVAGGGGAEGYVFLNGMTRWRGYVVADLPTPAVGIFRSIVTDAIGPAFLAIVVGGGTTTTPVFYDGTNWRCG